MMRTPMRTSSEPPVLGMLLVLLLVTLQMGAAVASLSCALAPASGSLVRVGDGRFLMGTVLDLSLLVEPGDEQRAREAMTRVFAQVASLAQNP